MILSTTNNIQNKKVNEYLGLVSGETILGINFVKDIFASFKDMLGGRSNTYEKEIIRARTTAIKELEQKAIEMGANAVIGINVEYLSIGSNGSMLVAVATGTAVKLSD